MTDPASAVADVIADLQAELEKPGISPDMTVGYVVEAPDAEALGAAVRHRVVELLAEEGRPVATIDPGGIVRTDSGYRAWGSISLGARS